MALLNVASGDPHVAAHNAERNAINALEDAIAGLDPASFDNVPPGSVFSVFFNEETGWPVARPSARTDIKFEWFGGSILDTPTAALAGVDTWERPVD